MPNGQKMSVWELKLWAERESRIEVGGREEVGREREGAGLEGGEGKE